MSPDLLLVVLVGFLMFCIGVGVGISLEWKDWGLLGLLLVANGICLLVFRVLAMEYGWVEHYQRDFLYAWRIFVLVGGVLMLLGFGRRMRAGWPPTRRATGRIFLITAVNVVVVGAIHLIRIMIWERAGL
jgi:hypothetical protein